MAIASASASSSPSFPALGSRTLIIMPTCCFPACPAPTTLFLTLFAAYSPTDKPFLAGTTRALAYNGLDFPSIEGAIVQTDAPVNAKGAYEGVKLADKWANTPPAA